MWNLQVYKILDREETRQGGDHMPAMLRTHPQSRARIEAVSLPTAGPGCLCVVACCQMAHAECKAVGPEAVPHAVHTSAVTSSGASLACTAAAGTVRRCRARFLLPSSCMVPAAVGCSRATCGTCSDSCWCLHMECAKQFFLRRQIHRLYPDISHAASAAVVADEFVSRCLGVLRHPLTGSLQAIVAYTCLN